MVTLAFGPWGASSPRMPPQTDLCLGYFVARPNARGEPFLHNLGARPALFLAAYALRSACGYFGPHPMSGLSICHRHVASSIVEYVSDGTAGDLCWDKVRPLWLFSLVGRARWHTTIFATCFGTVLLRPHSDPYRSGHKSVGAVTASPDLSNPTTSSGQFTGRPLSSLVWTKLGEVSPNV